MSLPEGSIPKLGKVMERGGSLPLTLSGTVGEENQKEREGEGLGFRTLEIPSSSQDPPKIRLVSPNQQQTPNQFDTLSSIPETSHSRENSTTTTTNPSHSPNSSPSLTNHSSRFPPPPPPLPFSPPLINLPSRSPLSTNKSRISIVGYPSSSSMTGSGHSRSPAQSSSYLSSPSSTPTIRPPSPSSSLTPGDIGGLEEKAKELAKKCWEEDEVFLERRKIASFLGST